VLKRAQHTLDLTLAEIGQTDIPVKKDLALNERDYGDLSGLNKDDARKKWGEAQVMSGGGPTTCRLPAAKA
jgi:2,3-bisphosphoglycerate-dependent phosphoglycerate mutase